MVWASPGRHSCSCFHLSTEAARRLGAGGQCAGSSRGSDVWGATVAHTWHIATRMLITTVVQLYMKLSIKSAACVPCSRI